MCCDSSIIIYSEPNIIITLFYFEKWFLVHLHSLGEMFSCCVKIMRLNKKIAKLEIYHDKLLVWSNRRVADHLIFGCDYGILFGFNIDKSLSGTVFLHQCICMIFRKSDHILKCSPKLHLTFDQILVTKTINFA